MLSVSVISVICVLISASAAQKLGPKAARCELTASAGYESVSGTIQFYQRSPQENLQVSGVIEGLSEGLHGFHVHQWGMLADGCKKASGHYNPTNTTHGAPDAAVRHVGDLGNIYADRKGSSIVNIFDDIASLYGENMIVGRSIVVHAGEDDLGFGGDEGSLKHGNAGPRVACCIIGAIGPDSLESLGTL